MTTIVSSVGLKGMEGYPVQVEVQTMPGTYGVKIIGLPSSAVKESKDRVLAALYANKCPLAHQKVIVQLSPEEERKNSPLFDLAMAIAIMKENGVLKAEIPKDAAFIGVLSLDGTIQSLDAMLPAIMAVKKLGFTKVFLPPFPQRDLIYFKGLEICYVTSLREMQDVLSGQLSMSSTLSSKHTSSINTFSDPTYDNDFQHILGHQKAKRALEIAAAGGHHVLMIGPPGCGKSLLAETFPSIFPTLELEDQLEVQSMYLLSDIKRSDTRIAPFRNPHHSASAISLIGGGTYPKPGEISLAHRGILFLDEIVEFSKKTLDMLRQPMETGKVTISRTASTVTYPTSFLLMAAMNSCPCGHLDSRTQYCTCTPKQVQAYQNRLSGPILDRFDIVLRLRPELIDKQNKKKLETSQTIRKRVAQARTRQVIRNNGIVNALLPNEDFFKHIHLNSKQEVMVQEWVRQYQWSTRVQMKVLRLARTIADLEGSQQISDQSLWEAMTMKRTKLETTKQRVVQ